MVLSRVSFGSGRRSVRCVGALVEGKCAYGILGVAREATPREIRAAYLQKIKELHPDVNTADTTQSACLLNLAYSAVYTERTNTPSGASQAALLPLDQHSAGLDEKWRCGDVFDEVIGEPSVLFVNPFRCFNVDPLQWRDLQSLAQSAPNPATALTNSGISFSESALSYLTPSQMTVIEAELDQMCETLNFDFCAYVLDDYLNRAVVVNGRTV